MKKRNLWLFVVAINIGLVWLAANAAAYAISDNVWNKAQKNISIKTVQQNSSIFEGATVIWGGEILETESTAQGTVLTVLETPMNYELRPEAENASRGVFIIQTKENLDPARYRKGKAITVGGMIAGSRNEQIDMARYITGGTYVFSGSYYPYTGTYLIGEPLEPKTYAAPIIQAEEHYLWPTHPAYTFPRYGKTSE